ncbi:MAG: hypothetical protein ACOC1W_04180 [Bacillota bacterium]
MKRISILVIILLLGMLSQQVQAEETSRVLDQDRITITLTIQEFYEIIMEGESLVLDLGSDTDAETRILTRSNLALTVSINSVHGFGEIDEYFKYVLRVEDDEYEDGYRDEEFLPGGELAPDIVYFEPGVNALYLMISLTDEMAGVWSNLLENDLTEIEPGQLGADWTEIAAGEYSDTLEITFSRM